MKKAKDVEKIERGIGRALYLCVLALMLISCLLLSNHVSKTADDTPFYRILLAYAVIVVLMFILYVMNDRFEKQIPGYKLLTKHIFNRRRLKRGAIAVAGCALLMILTNMILPIGTAPKKMPIAVSYTENGGRLQSGDFGVVAIKQKNHRKQECLLVPCSIEAYGPFNYAGEREEIALTEMRITCGTWTESNETILNGATEETIFVKFNHYEDGDWMIVKRFVNLDLHRDEYYHPIEDRDELELLTEILQSGEVAYKRYRMRNDYIEKLDTATNGLLYWEDTGHGIIWSE